MQTNIEQYWTNHIISRCKKHKSAMLQMPALSRRSLGEAKWSARPFCWTAAETTSRSACKASAEITRHTPLLVMQNVKMSKSHPTPTACRHCRTYIKASKLLNDLPQPSPRTSELAQHWQQPQAPLLCRFWSDPQNRGHCHIRECFPKWQKPCQDKIRQPSGTDWNTTQSNVHQVSEML